MPPRPTVKPAAPRPKTVSISSVNRAASAAADPEAALRSATATIPDPTQLANQAFEKEAQKLLQSAPVQKAVNVLPQRVKKIENRVKTQTEYALLTALGPFGEIPEAALDAFKDFTPAVEATNSILKVATPLLQLAAKQKHLLTVPGAVNLAAPSLATALARKGMPGTAQFVTQMHDAPDLKAGLAKLDAQGKLTNAQGELTDAAVTHIANHVHKQIKKTMRPDDKDHAKLDAAHQARSKTITPKGKIGQVATKKGGRRTRRRSMCPKPAQDGTGVKVMVLPGNDWPVYRWVTEIRADGRLMGRAPKVHQARIRDLCFLRRKDWGPEHLLPAGAQVHRGPIAAGSVTQWFNQTRRAVRSRRRRTKSRRSQRA